ncbi:MAG: hypothetical protein N2689_07335 [Verrucomicrobiae bacterium]|nr:hypothetical protein [Verrucomicrobiae bacterium]
MLVTGPSSFWKNSDAFHSDGLLLNRVGPRFLPGAVGDDGIGVAGKVLQITTGFTNSPRWSHAVNGGLLRALDVEMKTDAAQTFTNVGMIVVSNARNRSVMAPSADTAFSVGTVLINANGVIRLGRSSQFALSGVGTKQPDEAVPPHRRPLLQLNDGVTNFDTLSAVGPSTTIYSGILLLGPSGVVSVPDIKAGVSPAR